MELEKTLKVLCRDVTVLKPLRLVSTLNSGRGLVCEGDIEAGETLFVENPLVFGPSHRGEREKRDCCANCYGDIRNGEKSDQCVECGLYLCCKDGYDHAKDCKSLSQIPTLLQHRRTLSRWLTLHRALLLRSQSPDLWEKLMLLQGHEVRQQDTVDPVKADIKALLGEKDDKIVDRVLSILDGNAFRCDVRSNRSVYGLASMLNHDCQPNVRIVFGRDRSARVVAKRRIVAGEELTLTYCSPLLGTPARLAKLRSSKNFECLCRRCEDPTEFGSLVSALCCPKCADYLLFHKVEYRCRKCGFKTTKEKVDTLLDAVTKSQEKVLSSSSSEKRERRVEDLMSKHLQKLPPVHWVMLEFKLRLVDLRLGGVDRRMELVRERTEVLRTVDRGESRLLGFLCFRMHCLIVEKLAGMRRVGDDAGFDRTNEECGEELSETFRLAAKILKGDAGCPEELNQHLS